jgi:hypothetical protein
VLNNQQRCTGCQSLVKQKGNSIDTSSVHMVMQSMRKTLTLLLGVLPVGVPSDVIPYTAATIDSRHVWTRIRGWGAGSFQETWREGQVPLAIKPLVGLEGKLWMIGGRGVWSSRDGIQWTRNTTRLPWGDRYGAEASFHRGRLWLTGGEENRVLRNDVYQSRDGVQWQQVPAPPWSARRGHTLTVFNNRLLIIGGSGSRSLNDVWESDDGVKWRLLTGRAAWQARSGHSTVVWRDLICIVGGNNGRRVLNDAWCSKDGTSWSQLNAGHIPARMAPGVLTFDGKIWLFGGSAAGVPGDDTWLNDVWTLSPGGKWTQQNPRAPWSRRSAQYIVLFRNGVWLYGGKGIEDNGKGGFADDVWTFGAP